MKIDKEIKTEYYKMHTDQCATHKMTLDVKKFAESYKSFIADGFQIDNLLAFQGVGEIDDYVSELIKL